MKINDLNPYPLPPIKLPPASQIFTDPSFGTTILRVTQAPVGGSFTNGYSAIWDTFNADSTRFLYYGAGGNGFLCSLDVKKRTISPIPAVSKVATNNTFYWSRKDPDIFYIVEGWNSAKIWKYDFKAASYTLVVDLALLLPTIPQTPDTTWVGSRGMTWDENRFHVVFADQSVGVYDVKAGKMIGTGPIPYSEAFASCPNLTAGDWGKTTLDVTNGNVVYTATGPYLVANLETRTFFNVVYDANHLYGDDHPDFGPSNLVADMGGFVGSPLDGIYPLIITVDPNNLNSWLSNRKQIGPRMLWGMSTHSSFRDGKWNTLSIDFDTTETGKTPIFYKEIYQLPVDGLPDGSLNRRIVQHQTDPTQFTDANLAYNAQSKACVSQKGDCVGYCSTYGKSGSIDFYIAFLDDGNQMVEMTSDEVSAIKSLAAKL